MSDEMKVGDVWCDHRGEVRVMAVSEGYAMVRRPRAMPFVVSVRSVLNDDNWQPVRRYGQRREGGV